VGVKRRRFGPFAAALAVVGPGLLVAATGVGTGDLAGAGIAGSKLGVAVAWAIVVGAAMKLVITESLARYQIATGRTALEGAMLGLGRPLIVIFLVYLVLWTFVTASALISATGVTAHALVPVFEEASAGKMAFGSTLSLVGLALVWLGGFKLFERAMTVAIAVMFVTVLTTALLLDPDWAALAKGLAVPGIPRASGEGLAWTVGLIGGVGGTVTILCYSYWMREAGRDGREHLTTCRIDAAIGYGMTALFGVAMLVIAQGVELSGKGANLIVVLAERLREPVGDVGRAIFLAGAFAAVYSSLLGCWQAIPYLYADMWNIHRARGRGGADIEPVNTRGGVYRVTMVLTATVPMLGLLGSFTAVQMAYVVLGALFIPALAGVMLWLTTRRAAMGDLRSRAVGISGLALTVAFFLVFGAMKARSVLGL